MGFFLFQFAFTFCSSSTVVGRLTNSAADFRLAFKWFTAESSTVIYRKRNTKGLVTHPRRHSYVPFRLDLNESTKKDEDSYSVNVHLIFFIPNTTSIVMIV